jgi:O-antigen biosynthesis protein
MQYNPHIDLSDDYTMSHTRVIELVGRGKNVLDVGCARGNTGAILVTKFSCTASGIELDRHAAEYSRQSYQEVIVGDIEELTPFERLQHGPFDVIIFGDILEHLRQPERVLRATPALLKPGGYALISLPNVVTLRLRLHFLFGRFEYTDQGIMDRTHLRFFTVKTARELITTSGFIIEHFEFLVGPNFGRRLKRLGIPRNWLPASLSGTKFIFKVRPQRSDG